VIYREVRAEVRRVRRPWLLAGIVLSGAWHPAMPGVHPASGGLVMAGLARTVELPPFLAPDDRTAWRVALDVAQMEGYAVPRSPDLPPGGGGHWIDGPDLSDVL
jgi:hypothetical protein